MFTNGNNRECTYSVRVYAMHEFGKILHDVGFKLLEQALPVLASRLVTGDC
jgi:hypothetical protein